MSAAARQQVVLGRRKPAGSVANRDFGSPQRMAPERLRELAVQLENLLPDLERRLLDGVGARVDLRLQGLGECDVDQVLEHLADPLCVLRFRAGGEPAWLVWDPAAAVGMMEAVLGGRGEAPPARKLSPTEATVVTEFLTLLVAQVAPALEIVASEPALVQARTELGSWREGGGDAEPHRLEARVAVRRGTQDSILAFYLPGIGGGEPRADERALPERLPAHLDQVEIEVSARLKGCEISLDQLLALEEGDVIPLEARVGEPTDLCVDGLTLAEGRLGSHDGRLAVRIERMKVVPETLR